MTLPQPVTIASVAPTAFASYLSIAAASAKAISRAIIRARCRLIAFRITKRSPILNGVADARLWLA
jgi:hypothetical protein